MIEDIHVDLVRKIYIRDFDKLYAIIYPIIYTVVYTIANLIYYSVIF